MNLEAGGEGLWSMRENLVISPERRKCHGWEPLSSPKEQEAGPEATGSLGRALAEDGLGVECFIPTHLPSPLGLYPQANHLRCLHEFVESQTTYYAQCYRHMLDLQKQLGRCPLGSPGFQAP